MILVLSLNSALDKTYLVRSLALGRMNRPERELALAGGKGVNVARVLKRLGQPVKLIACVAGRTGERIREKVEEERIPAEWIEVRGESRECLAFIDGKGDPTELNEAGPVFDASDVARVRGTVAASLSRAKVLVCSGSLPPGVPVDFYAELIREARRRGVETVLDTSGPALRAGLRAGPALAKPNEEELRSVSSERSAEKAVDVLIRSGARMAVVTRGRRGFVAGFEKDGPRWQVVPPALKAMSAIGCGDTLLAGILRGMQEGWEVERTLREAAALAAANALVLGAGIYRDKDVGRLKGRIRIRRLSSGASSGRRGRPTPRPRRRR